MKKIFSFLCALMVTVAMNATVVTFTFNTDAGLAELGIDKPSQGAGTNLTSVSKDGVTIAFDKGNATTNPRVWCTSGASAGTLTLRVYNGSTITVSVEGMTGVEFAGSATFSEFTGLSWAGNADSQAFSPTATTNITTITVTYGEAAQVWTADTIGVSQARALIVAGDKHDHFVKGVVATYPSTLESGKTTFWLTDIETPTDSLQGYHIADYGGASFISQPSIPFTITDTVLLYASSLMDYKGKYEISEGYLAEILGSSITTQNLEYTAGIVDYDSRDGVMTISLGEDFNTDDIEASAVAAFAGTYYTNVTIGDDVALENAKLVFTFVEVKDGAHVYHVSMVFTQDGVRYVIDSDVALTCDDASFGTIDDGSRISFLTVESALAKCIATGETATADKFNVVGYAISIEEAYTSKDDGGFGNATFNIADNADETDESKMIKVYRCYPVDNLPEADRTIVVGKRYLINGKLVNFKGNTPEIAQYGTYDLYEATAIEDIKVLDGSKTFKTIYNGQVVIIKNGEIFNILGTRL